MYYSTGVKHLDKLLGGGLALGENVLWEIETGTFAQEFLLTFMKRGIEENNQVIFLDFIYPPQALLILLEPLVKRITKGLGRKTSSFRLLFRISRTRRINLH